MAKYFNRQFLTTFALTGIGGVSVYSLTKILVKEEVEKSVELKYNKIIENTEQKWDSNWDKRSPKSLVKPVDSNKPEHQNKYDKKVESQKSSATRHIFLIRHGQYNISGETDEDRKLTELGRKQALYTGERLSVLNYPWTTITQSTMTRAMETCSIIREKLPSNIPLISTDLLIEGAPVQPDPPSKHWKPDLYQFYRDGARIEAAFRKFIHRAPPEQKEDSFELIICHANVIRYFVMRSLQLTPEAWLRLSLDHASITSLSIFPNGRVALRCFSNSGYMPPDAISH